MEQKQNVRVFNIGIKTFLGALVMLLVLMVLTYALTMVLPAGSYERTLADGKEMIVAGTYAPAEGGIPFWKWLLSPLLVLSGEDGFTILAIIAFLLVIGGAFSALDAHGVMSYMLGRIYSRFEKKRYFLLAVVSLFFMGMGSLVGSFEECVPLVPLCAALAYSMGWDALVGLGMSVFAVGCGFAAGVMNPFTVGVAQELAGLSMFSGMDMRVISFVAVYGILMAFLIPYARRIEGDPKRSPVYDEAAREKWAALKLDFQREARMDRALYLFAGILLLGILFIVTSSFVPSLQGIVMPVIALMFLIAGTASVLASGMKLRAFIKHFIKGVTSILPAVLLILMASSVKYTLVEAHILDTILYGVLNWTQSASQNAVVLVIYLLVLVMNLFIASGSAKAFLLMPLIAPLADMTGISRQLSVLAFIYGDGFSNVFYPTNPVLLISLGIVGVSYGKWARWSVKMQLAILAVTCALLLLANAVGY